MILAATVQEDVKRLLQKCLNNVGRKLHRKLLALDSLSDAKNTPIGQASMRLEAGR